MSTDHTETVRGLIDDAGYEDVVAGPFREDNPAKFIAVLSAPGVAPQALLNGGEEAMNQDGVQVLVRGTHDGFGELKARADAVYEAVKFERPDGYIGIYPQGKPSYIGDDDDNRPLISMNFICHIKE